jgi:hypothetical protein
LKRLGWERAIRYVEELRAGATQVLGISTEDESYAGWAGIHGCEICGVNNSVLRCKGIGRALTG